MSKDAMTNFFSSYYDADAIRSAVAKGDHREAIGGLWDKVGQLQIDFLRREGLLPHNRLLDVGCGSLRAGVRFVRYLEAGHYFGLDLNRSLIDAGFENEIRPLGLDDRLPRENLIDDADFNVERFKVRFDFAIALSVFTHLPLDVIRVCLERMPVAMVPDGRFYASFFEASSDRPTHIPVMHSEDGIQTYAGRDPYHQRFSDFEHLCVGLPWKLDYIGEFGHPRGQRMLRFTRL